MALALPARAIVVETAPGASEHPAASASFPASDLFRLPIAHAATDEAPSDTQGSSLFERLSAWFAGIFGRERTAQVATPSVISDSEASEPANADSSTTTAIIYQTVNQPVIERVVEVPVAAGVSEATLAERLATLAGTLNERIQNAFLGAARSAVVENVSDITVDGVSGLTDADIPNDITASNYLALSGGTLTGSLTGTDLTLSGDLTVSGAQTLSGAITIPYLTATSTTASSFIQASTTRFSVFDTAYFGGTATSTFDSAGNLSVAGTLTATGGLSTVSNLLLTGSTTLQNFTFLSATGTSATTTNFFSTNASSTNLHTSNLFVGSLSGFLKATAGAIATALIDLANDVTGILPIANGGTNATSLGSDMLLGFNGTSVVSTSTPTAAAYLATSTSVASTFGYRVGIGTTSPYAKLSVVGPVVAEYFHATSSSATSTFAGGITGPNNFVVQQTSGNVGVGTTSPAYKFDVDGNVQFGVPTANSVIRLVGDTSFPDYGVWLTRYTSGVSELRHQGTAALLFMAEDAAPTIFKNNGSESMHITSSGNVGISRTPTTNDLEVEGTASTTASGDWLANSDQFIKTDIVTASGLDILAQLRPVEFRYTDEYRALHPSIEDKVYYNFIAQEFAEVFPDFVKGSGEFLPDGHEILQIDTYPAQVVAIRAIQELDLKLEDLATTGSTGSPQAAASGGSGGGSSPAPAPAPSPTPEPSRDTTTPEPSPAAPSEAPESEGEEPPPNEPSPEEQEGLEPPIEEDGKEEAEATSTPELSEVESPSIIPEDHETDKQEPGETSDEADDEPLQEQPEDSEASANSALGSEQTDAERTAQEAEDANAPSSSSDAVDIDEPPEPSEPQAEEAPSSEAQPLEQ